ncbi:hypothetical protein [Janibacter anophelis]|uniref:hypothetical protein n=1 Tax=Janibacter anophelis TaxID=319054 RepID=UPI001963BE38|nr:hypothetical protein [Janibacter anophelis]
MKEREAPLPWGWDDTGPVWGARVFSPRRGQDHLGLGSVSSDRILPALAPGINVLTIHPRYFSFYAWVLDSFWLKDLPRTRAAFKEFYRPREALFAMACHVCDAPEHETLLGSIVGSQRVRGLSGGEAFDPSYDYIKEPLGGYGLYYRSTMELMGALVVASPENGFPFDAPTAVGRALAAAYSRSIENTALATQLADNTPAGPVTRSELLEFARRACLCQLRAAGDNDLPLLQDLFLHAGAPRQAGARRHTLRFMLDLSQSCQHLAISQPEFRQLVYFRTLDGSAYAPRADLTDAARRWRIYQAREYFAFVFNRLFAWIVRRGLEASGDGLSLVPQEGLWAMVDEALASNHFAASVGLDDETVGTRTTAADLIGAIARRIDLTPGVDEVWPRDEVLDENALYEWCNNTTDDAETLVAMLALLLMLHRRVGTPVRTDELSTEHDLTFEGGSLRIGMSSFFRQLSRKVMAGVTLSELARWVIHDYVIVQHERVATNKLPDDTFRVRRVGSALRFFDQEAPAGFSDSRYHALSTTIHELGLVSTLLEPHRELTDSGRRLLEEGDLPAGALDIAASAYVSPMEPAS